MKRILFIIPSIWAGGTHSSLSSIIAHYNPQLWNVSVFAITGFGERESSYKQFLLPRDRRLTALYAPSGEQKGFYVLFWKTLNKLLHFLGFDLKEFATNIAVRKIDKNEYDTVVGFMEGSANYMASLFDCKHKIAWIHCNYDKYLPAGKSEENIYKRFESIICVSKYTASVFKNRYPDLAIRTDYIYNLLDTERILELSGSSLNDTRFTKHGLTLLSVGRITSVKRFSAIPDIAHSLKNKGVFFHWYLIGPDFDVNETNLLKSNIEKYKISDCFTWLGGKQNPYPYFKASDIYVCVSESEACPMVFNEARIFGLPIVSTDFPSAVEFISNGEDGIITPFIDVADALVRIMKDEAFLNTMRAKSSSRIFDNEQEMKKIEKII